LGIGTQVTQCSATGRATFSVPEALDLSDEGVPVILVGSVDFVIYNFQICNEPSPDDISGITVAEGVLAMHGGFFPLNEFPVQF
jgi:hypothetical protein